MHSSRRGGVRLSGALDNGARGGFPGMLRATVQRSRSNVRAPEASGEVSEPESLGEVPSPRWLLEEVRAPGVARAEVDALLRGLELPLGPGETARERADLLHEIIEDEQVREYTGSGGRKVAHVAVLRLGELGFPYALEVPPELFAEARAGRRGGAAPREDSERSGTAGTGMVLVAGGLEVLPAIVLAANGRPADMAYALVWILAASLTSFVPALLADSEPVLRTRWLHYLMLLAVALPGLGWLGLSLLVLGLSGVSWLALFSVLPLGMALLRLGGAKGLYGPPPDEEPSDAWPPSEP